MNLSTILKSFAHEKGIIIGMCDAKPLHLPEIASVPPFFRHTRNQRENPDGLLRGAKSIIVVGVGYNRELLFETDDEPRGVFSLGAVGLDYHISVRAVLKEIEARLRCCGFLFECAISVDTGPLSEKDLAVKAGLGFRGKNGLVISEKLGSFFNIGYMVTTLEYYDSVEADLKTCGECNRCVHACPGGALSESDGFAAYDYRKCVSYLTQKKGTLGEEEQKQLGRGLYGCDICQKACPLNINTYVGKIESIDIVMPRLADVLALTKKDFSDKYKSTAIYWRGLGNLKRNAMYAQRNCI